MVIESAIDVAGPKVKKTDEEPRVPWWKKAATTFWTGIKAFLFVLIAFAFWFLFVRLANIVTGRCPLESWWPPTECTIDQASLQHWSSTVILLATLPFAVWAARRLVFPPDD